MESASSNSLTRVLVVGSINMDLVVRSERLPRPGETLTGRSFSEIPGGKGANQAVAAARLGSPVAMVGCVGDDVFAPRLRHGLQSNRVDISHVSDIRGCSSGVAIIGVEDSGQNCITVVPGANAHLTPAHLKQAEDVFQGASVVLLQLEIPVDTVLAAMNIARQHGLLIIFDPAPAKNFLPPQILDVDVVCPNETEAQMLTGIAIHNEGDAARAARRLCEMGAKNSVITLGDRGVLWCSQHQVEMIEAFDVNAVDSTAAGDAFAAALGLRMAEGAEFPEAVRFACAAGAVAASREGAQPAMPSRDDVEQLLLA